MTAVTQPIGLSTSWNGPGASPAHLLDQHRGLGFRRLAPTTAAPTTAATPIGTIAIGDSVMLGAAPQLKTALGPDSYVDAHVGRQFKEAVAMIDSYASTGKLGHVVVVHLGNSGVFSRQAAIFDTIARYGRLSDEHLRLRDSAWQEREAAKRPHLDAALQSMRALGEHAHDSGVRLGVECRDGYFEIPSLDEFGEVLSACAGLPVGYWHDAGHGAKLDYLGFVEHEEFLRRYAAQIVGMHIHDTRAGRDHLAPGQGNTDFAMLGRYLRPETVRTLELSRVVTAAEINQALDLLEPLEVFGVREGIMVSF